METACLWSFIERKREGSSSFRMHQSSLFDIWEACMHRCFICKKPLILATSVALAGGCAALAVDIDVSPLGNTESHDSIPKPRFDKDAMPHHL